MLNIRQSWNNSQQVSLCPICNVPWATDLYPKIAQDMFRDFLHSLAIGSAIELHNENRNEVSISIHLGRQIDNTTGAGNTKNPKLIK